MTVGRRMLASGTRIAERFRIEASIAGGGMGTVYRAYDERSGHEVALKILLPDLAQDTDALMRFEREARIIAQLEHPGIVRLLEVGHARDPSGVGMLAFIAMELVRGPTLAAVIAQGPMPEARVIRIGVALATALGHAHARRITHRDVKPENCMLVEGSDQVKLLDFGVAQLKTGSAYTRLTQTGMIVGTPLFMSPEQARSEPCDERADVYSLGLVLWACATGRNPYRGDSLAHLMMSILEEVPPRLDAIVPGSSQRFASAVETPIQKRPEQRFASMAELAKALEDRSRSAAPPPTSIRPRAHADSVPPPPPMRSWPLVGLALSGAGVPAALLLVAYLFGTSAPSVAPNVAASPPPPPGAAPDVMAPPPSAASPPLAPGAAANVAAHSTLDAETLAMCNMVVTCCIELGTPRADCEPMRDGYLAYPASAWSNCLRAAGAIRDGILSMRRPTGACVLPP